MNSELAIHLDKCPEVEITFFLPQCSQMDKKEAHENSVRSWKQRVGLALNNWSGFAFLQQIWKSTLS